MPDITMCKGDGCPLRENCYRFTATPSQYWQSYMMEVPYNEETGNCDHFWKDI